MQILSRYVLRAHVGPFLFALSVLTGMLYINTVARLLPALAGKGLPASVFARLLLLSLPHIVALTLPMAVLVATLYAFSSLAADNEITALKASGVNMARMLLPVLVPAAALTALMVWFNDRVLPQTNHELQLLGTSVGAMSPTLILTEQVVTGIPATNPGVYVRAGRVDHRSGRLQDVTIYDLQTRDQSRTIYADSGLLRFNQDTTDLFLTLYAGEMLTVRGGKREALERTRFQEQRTIVRDAATRLDLRARSEYRGDRELTLGMLRARIDHARDALRAPAAEPALPSRADSLQRSINEYRVEYHKKFAIPVACMVFVLVGAPLAVRFPRGGVGMVIAISLTIFASYYVSLIGGESLGNDGVIAPFIGPWAPNAAFGLLALWGVAHIGRETSSTRGGDWEDLWRSAVWLLARRSTGRRRWQ